MHHDSPSERGQKSPVHATPGVAGESADRIYVSPSLSRPKAVPTPLGTAHPKHIAAFTQSNDHAAAALRSGDAETSRHLLTSILPDLRHRLALAESLFPYQSNEVVDSWRLVYALTLNNYGCQLRRDGHAAKAIENFREAQTVETAVFGKPSCSTMLNLSAVLVSEGETKEGLEIAAECAAAAQDGEPILFVTSLHNLAVAFGQQKSERRRRAALPTMLQALREAQNALGEDHPTTQMLKEKCGLSAHPAHPPSSRTSLVAAAAEGIRGAFLDLRGSVHSPPNVDDQVEEATVDPIIGDDAPQARPLPTSRERAKQALYTLNFGEPVAFEELDNVKEALHTIPEDIAVESKRSPSAAARSSTSNPEADEEAAAVGTGGQGEDQSTPPGSAASSEERETSEIAHSQVLDCIDTTESHPESIPAEERFRKSSSVDVDGMQSDVPSRKASGEEMLRVASSTLSDHTAPSTDAEEEPEEQEASAVVKSRKSSRTESDPANGDPRHPSLPFGSSRRATVMHAQADTFTDAQQQPEEASENSVVELPATRPRKESLVYERMSVHKPMRRVNSATPSFDMYPMERVELFPMLRVQRPVTASPVLTLRQERLTPTPLVVAEEEGKEHPEDAPEVPSTPSRSKEGTQEEAASADAYFPEEDNVPQFLTNSAERDLSSITSAQITDYEEAAKSAATTTTTEFPSEAQPRSIMSSRNGPSNREVASSHTEDDSACREPLMAEAPEENTDQPRAAELSPENSDVPLVRSHKASRTASREEGFVVQRDSIANDDRKPSAAHSRAEMLSMEAEDEASAESSQESMASSQAEPPSVERDSVVGGLRNPSEAAAVAELVSAEPDGDEAERLHRFSAEASTTSMVVMQRDSISEDIRKPYEASAPVEIVSMELDGDAAQGLEKLLLSGSREAYVAMQRDSISASPRNPSVFRPPGEMVSMEPDGDAAEVLEKLVFGGSNEIYVSVQRDSILANPRRPSGFRSPAEMTWTESNGAAADETAMLACGGSAEHTTVAEDPAQWLDQRPSQEGYFKEILSTEVDDTSAPHFQETSPLHSQAAVAETATEPFQELQHRPSGVKPMRGMETIEERVPSATADAGSPMWQTHIDMDSLHGPQPHRPSAGNPPRDMLSTETEVSAIASPTRVNEDGANRSSLAPSTVKDSEVPPYGADLVMSPEDLLALAGGDSSADTSLRLISAVASQPQDVTVAVDPSSGQHALCGDARLPREMMAMEQRGSPILVSQMPSQPGWYEAKEGVNVELVHDIRHHPSTVKAVKEMLSTEMEDIEASGSSKDDQSRSEAVEMAVDREPAQRHLHPSSYVVDLKRMGSMEVVDGAASQASSLVVEAEPRQYQHHGASAASLLEDLLSIERRDSSVKVPNIQSRDASSAANLAVDASVQQESFHDDSRQGSMAPSVRGILLTERRGPSDRASKRESVTIQQEPRLEVSRQRSITTPLTYVLAMNEGMATPLVPRFLRQRGSLAQAVAVQRDTVRGDSRKSGIIADPVDLLARESQTASRRSSVKISVAPSAPESVHLQPDTYNPVLRGVSASEDAQRMLATELESVMAASSRKPSLVGRRTHSVQVDMSESFSTTNISRDAVKGDSSPTWTETADSSLSWKPTIPRFAVTPADGELAPLSQPGRGSELGLKPTRVSVSSLHAELSDSSTREATLSVVQQASQSNRSSASQPTAQPEVLAQLPTVDKAISTARSVSEGDSRRQRSLFGSQGQRSTISEAKKAQARAEEEAYRQQQKEEAEMVAAENRFREELDRLQRRTRNRSAMRIQHAWREWWSNVGEPQQRAQRRCVLEEAQRVSKHAPVQTEVNTSHRVTVLPPPAAKRQHASDVGGSVTAGPSSPATPPSVGDRRQRTNEAMPALLASERPAVHVPSPVERCAQQWLRKTSGVRYVARNSVRPVESVRHEADVQHCATLIQTAWRGFRARRDLPQLRREHEKEANEVRNAEERIYAAIVIELAYRAYAARRVVACLRREKDAMAATTIQHWFRHRWELRRERGMDRRTLQRRNEAAVRIQKTWRGYQGRLRFRMRELRVRIDRTDPHRRFLADAPPRVSTLALPSPPAPRTTSATAANRRANKDAAWCAVILSAQAASTMPLPQRSFASMCSTPSVERHTPLLHRIGVTSFERDPQQVPCPAPRTVSMPVLDHLSDESEWHTIPRLRPTEVVRRRAELQARHETREVDRVLANAARVIQRAFHRWNAARCRGGPESTRLLSQRKLYRRREHAMALARRELSTGRGVVPHAPRNTTRSPPLGLVRNATGATPPLARRREDGLGAWTRKVPSSPLTSAGGAAAAVVAANPNPTATWPARLARMTDDPPLMDFTGSARFGVLGALRPAEASSAYPSVKGQLDDEKHRRTVDLD